MASIFDVGTNLGLNPNSVGGQILNVDGAISGGIPGIEHLAAGETPTYNAPTMNPGSQAQVSQVENGLLAGTPAATAAIMNGTGGAGSIQDQSSNAQRQTQELGGGGMPGANEAISARAAKNFATAKGRLQQNANLQGAETANQNVNTAATMSQALMNAQTGVNSALNNLQLQYNQAQYQTVAGIMSGAGTAAGIFAGSRGGNNNSPGYPGLNSSLDAVESTFGNPTGENSSGYLGSNIQQPNYASDVGGNYNFSE